MAYLTLIRHYSFGYRGVDEPPAAGNASCLDGNPIPMPTPPELMFCSVDLVGNRSASGARGFRLIALAQMFKFCRLGLSVHVVATTDRGNQWGADADLQRV